MPSPARSFRALAALLALAALASSIGCATYVTPAAGYAPGALADEDLQGLLDREPAAPWPARLASVRIQSSGYASYRTSSYGRGRFSVVTTREVETDDHVERLPSLPMVAGIAALNRIVIPEVLESDRELRLAAASVKADLLLVYSLDTSFRIEDHEIGPLGVLTLGLLPNKEALVTTTASAAIYDVRTGYIYGLAESTARESQLASAWSSREAVDASRVDAEAAAFDGLVGELEEMWGELIAAYGPPSTEG